MNSIVALLISQISTTTNLKKTTLANLVFFILTGCSQNNPQFEPPFRAEVLTLIEPKNISESSWIVSAQELPTLENIDSLDGKHFQVKLGGTINIKNSSGSLLDTEDVSDSDPPKLRFFIKNGTIIPRDSTTLYALSTFHAFEKIMLSLKNSTGLEISEYLNSIQGKFRIRFEPSFRTTNSDGTATLTLKFNAAFDPFSNQFILFKRSEAETVPFSNNIKVLAHEFGHALFKSSFFNQGYTMCTGPTPEQEKERVTDKFFPGRLETEFAISGFNEGYSDFFSYIVTSAELTSDDFGGALGYSRSLTGPAFRFSQLYNSDTCSNSYYCIGTLFARALFQTSEIYKNDQNEKMAFSRRVFSALKGTQSKMREKTIIDKIPIPNLNVVKCGRSRRVSSAYDGAISSAFLSAFINSFTLEVEKKELCQNMKSVFDISNEKQENEIVCSL